MKKELIVRPGYKGGLGGRAWSPGLKIGPWLLLSGITPVDYDKGETTGLTENGPFTPPTVDPAQQWRTVLGNIKEMVEAAGGTMDDICLANVFVTDMHYYSDYQHIRKEFWNEPYPVCTALEVSRLVDADWVLEIECWAYIED